MSGSTDSGRLDYLDAARAFALLLGILFHASLSFLPVYIGWAVMDVSTSEVVSSFTLVSHAFRMPLFFLLAGFFGRMSMQQKGASRFVGERLLRIAVPFLVLWFVLRPMLVSGWIMGAESMRGEVDINAALAGGVQALLQLPDNLFTGTHLWFLYYLLLVTGIVLLLRPVTRFSNVPLRVVNWIIQWLVRSPVAILFVALPVSLCLWFMPYWGLDTPDKSLLPNWPVLLIYAGFFILGWGLHRMPDGIQRFGRLSWLTALLCLGSVAITLWLADIEGNVHHPHYGLLKSLYLYAYALMMCALVVLTIGFFQRYLARPVRVIRYLAGASYWLYLIHLPIVIWLQVAFAEVALHWSFKLLAVSGLTLILSLLMYEFFVRRSVIGWLLTGKRQPGLLKRERAPA